MAGSRGSPRVGARTEERWRIPVHVVCIAELMLTALACSGAIACVALTRAPNWFHGARIGGIAGVEQCIGVRFPAGSKLEEGYYGGGFLPFVLAVLRAPGPPSAVATAEPFDGGDPARLFDSWPELPTLPEPQSLGLSDDPLQVQVGCAPYGHGLKRGVCQMWLYFDAPRNETTVYVHWWIP